MRTLTFALAVIALAVIPATADSWTKYEYSYTWDGYFYYMGESYYGTFTEEISYQWKDNGQNYFFKGSFKWRFDAADGSLFAKSAGSYPYYETKFGYNSALVYKADYHYLVKADGLPAETYSGAFHMTFNANGELVSYHYKP